MTAEQLERVWRYNDDLDEEDYWILVHLGLIERMGDDGGFI